jgi:hypothetical protein
MLTGLRESVIQNCIGLRMLLLNFWRILRYGLASYLNVCCWKGTAIGTFSESSVYLRLSSLCSFLTLLNMSDWSLLTSIKYLLFSFQKAHHIMLHSQYNRDLINVNIRLCKNFIFTCVNGSYIPCYYCVYKGGSGGEVVSSRDKPWPARTMQRVIINRSKGWLVFLVIFLVIILMDFRFELCYSYGFDCNTLSVLSFCSQSIWVFMWQVMKRYSFLKVFWVLYSFISCWLTSVLFFPPPLGLL